MELKKKIENQIIRDLKKEGWGDYLHKGSAVSLIIAEAAEKVIKRENKKEKKSL